MTTVREALTAYIADAQEREAVWGIDDCSPWAHRWAEQMTGRTIERPQYSSEAEAMAMIAEAGSLDRVWEDIMIANGIAENYPPEYGDVGVVDLGRFGQVGGIFLAGGYFVWRTRHGVNFIQPRLFVRSWSLNL